MVNWVRKQSLSHPGGETTPRVQPREHSAIVPSGPPSTVPAVPMWHIMPASPCTSSATRMTAEADEGGNDPLLECINRVCKQPRMPSSITSHPPSGVGRGSCAPRKDARHSSRAAPCPEPCIPHLPKKSRSWPPEKGPPTKKSNATPPERADWMPGRKDATNRAMFKAPRDHESVVTYEAQKHKKRQRWCMGRAQWLKSGERYVHADRGRYTIRRKGVWLCTFIALSLHLWQRERRGSSLREYWREGEGVQSDLHE